MTQTTLNQAVPDFTAPATNGKNITLSELKNKNIILYFYPKDNTPGCTLEGQQFRDHIDQFIHLDTVILGVSCDSIASHEKFKTKQCFPFDLLSDPDGKLCDIFGVRKPKKIFGKSIFGVERSTFLIDKNGLLRKEWRQVKVNGHVTEVLDAIKTL